MPEDSSSPYNPRDRIKRHLKRKSSSRNLTQVFDSKQTPKVFTEIDTESCPVPSTSNPFKVGSPLKKRRPTAQVNFADSVFDLEENAQDSFGDNVIGYARPKIVQKTPTKSPQKSPRKRVNKTSFERYRSFDPSTLLRECYATDFSQLLGNEKSINSKITEEEYLEESEEVPMDLRIATKIRISSSTPFPWMNSRRTTGIVAVRLSASERYEGLKYFNELFMGGKENLQVLPPLSPIAFLEAATMFWQFPVVPGMSLYPRISSQLGTLQRVPMSPLVTTTMFNQWVEGYEQLFHSYKKGDRECFYVASAAFNVLFTKTSESDEIDVNEDSQSCFRTSTGRKMIAIVTHTTSAVREHLRGQGVEYEVMGSVKQTLKRDSSTFALNESSSMMVESAENSLFGLAELEGKENSVSDPANFDTIGGMEEDSDENDSPTKANQQWLKDIGVSPRNVIRTASRKLSSRLTDKGEGISCLLVKGSSVQSLYNTLMSSDIVHEKTGPYTKIPPTLIAASPFLYGQLLSLNKTSHIVQKPGKEKKTEYILEFDRGPVLPHSAKMVCEFVRRANLCSTEQSITLRVSDRHANNGMNEWTNRASDWNSLDIFANKVTWKKGL